MNSYHTLRCTTTLKTLFDGSFDRRLPANIIVTIPAFHQPVDINLAS
jgi:hypothetical protein